MINAKLMNIELTEAFSCNINFSQSNQPASIRVIVISDHLIL